MSQLEQFREQCAKTIELYDDAMMAHDDYVLDPSECAGIVRTLPLPEVDQWKSIDTAPADGNCLVAVNTDDGFYICRLERDKRGNWIHEGEPTFCKSYFFDPEYWMPLPDLPTIYTEDREYRNGGAA